MKTNGTWNLEFLLTTYDVSFADFCGVRKLLLRSRPVYPYKVFKPF